MKSRPCSPHVRAINARAKIAPTNGIATTEVACAVGRGQVVRRRFLVIHNPTAGRRCRRRLQQVLDGLRAGGRTVIVHHTGSFSDNRALIEGAIRTGGFDAVVAAGGDGTIRGAASALLGTGMPLGIIPIGTGNVMAHEIGLPLCADAITECLLKGRVASVPAACANGQPFLLMAGVGFDCRVIGLLDSDLKRRIGKLAYVWPVIRALLAGPDAVRVSVDGAEHSASWVVAAAARHYAGAFVLAPAARLDEPSLQVVLFKARGRWSMVRQLTDAALGRIAHRSDILHLPAISVEITSERPVPVQLDGEAFGATPVRILAGEATLQLIVPPASEIGRRDTWAEPLAAVHQARR
jgi:diacylglycerol kinase (ATP)